MRALFKQLFPGTIDNNYRGRKIALWLFSVVLLLKIVMSVNSIFNGYSVATSADGIPLDTYPTAAAQTILSLWAVLGLSRFMLCLICLLALIRYRSMVPLMFALLLMEQLSRYLILQRIPIIRTGSPPAGYINLILLALMIVGLTLSLWRRPT